MKRNTVALFLLAIFFLPTLVLSLEKKPIIFYTAALIKNKYPSRKMEYLQSLEILKEYGYTPFIIESVTKKKKVTFFNQCNVPVLYTKSNKSWLRNKGVNECLSLIKAFEHYQFDDNDMIVKITGRYFFTSDKFLRDIEERPEIDAWVKYCPNGFVFTGCFALRAKYFKQLLYTIDYKNMEKNMLCLEELTARYIDNIEQQGARVHHVDQLCLTANLFFSGRTQLIYQ